MCQESCQIFKLLSQSSFFSPSWTHGRDTSQTWNFSKEERKDPLRNQGCQKVGFEPATLGSVVQRSNYSAIQLKLPNRWKIFAIYAPTLLMYIVASPDPNPRGGGQLLTLTSAILR